MGYNITGTKVQNSPTSENKKKNNGKGWKPDRVELKQVEVEEYNRHNGTNFSYGVYFAYKSNGLLKTSIDMGAVIAEVHQYNQENNTSHSYWSYIKLKESGKIK